MDEYIIKIKNLTKTFKVPEKAKEGFLSSLKLLFKRKYKLIKAVDNVSLRIKKGEIRGLIGPNGAGKSTLIKMISGILYPTSGTIDVTGYTPWNQREKYVRNIGVLLGQKTQLVWDLPAIDTFALNKQIYKIPEKKYNMNLEYFEDIFNIKDVIRKPVRNLSLGERIKCELVCSILHEPGLVYLDEPTIGMDLFAKDAIRKFIKQINRDKKITFILTTHDLNDIENLCENVTIINHGKIIYDDSIDKLKLYFSNKRLIEVIFSEQVPCTILNKFNVIDSTPLSIKIELDLSKNNLQNEVKKIFKALPVKDITIENINIEEVIKEIYKR